MRNEEEDIPLKNCVGGGVTELSLVHDRNTGVWNSKCRNRVLLLLLLASIFGLEFLFVIWLGREEIDILGKVVNHTLQWMNNGSNTLIKNIH